MQNAIIKQTEFPASSRKDQRSTLVSRNVTISSRRTSVRLEPEMWSGLSEVCRREDCSMHEMCTAIAGRKHENTSLTAAIRVFVMSYFRNAATEEGHSKTGHGFGVVALIASLAGNRAGATPNLPTAPPVSTTIREAIPSSQNYAEPRPFAKSATRNFR